MISLKGLSVVAGCMISFVPISHAQLQALDDAELATHQARSGLPQLPLFFDEETGFDLSSASIAVDMAVQSSIENIAWHDDDGIGQQGTSGQLLLSGIHIGSIASDISAQQVRSENPFSADDLALVRGLLVQADPQTGTVISINQLGNDQGQGIDFIFNDIYFGADLSASGQRGMGLLLEDVSNFVSYEYLETINQSFSLNLALDSTGFGNELGQFYPLHFAMTPIEGGAVDTGLSELSQIGGIIGLPSFGGNSMIMDAQFLLYMKKLAVYRDDFEMGIEGLLIYNGLDTNHDGIEDTIGPVVMSQLTMETKSHVLASGSQVQAMHISNINVNMDIAMANIYIGNSQTGSLGALHIDDLNISNTQMWIYPK